MRFEALTVFPDVFAPIMGSSILGRARAKGAYTFHAHDLRDWTHDVHRTVDDSPYGGGQGMLMKVEPFFEALDDIEKDGPTPHVVAFTPAGEPFTQECALDLLAQERIVFLCGRYEGLDERIMTRVDREVSLGDYVLTGGELAAMVVMDAVIRLIPGVLGDDGSAWDESFSEGLLEYSQYTRPAEYRGLEVPPTLLSGDHAAIARWRRRDALRRTALRRPDLLAGATLTDEERAFISSIRASEEETTLE